MKTRDDLRGILRAWDREAALDIAPAEAELLRARIVAAAGHRAAPAWLPRLVPVGALAAALLLAVVLGFPPRDPGLPGALPEPLPVDIVRAAGPPPGWQSLAPVAPPRIAPVLVAKTAPAARTRQIHFTTRGGTRLIWVLNPALPLGSR